MLELAEDFLRQAEDAIKNGAADKEPAVKAAAPSPASLPALLRAIADVKIPWARFKELVNNLDRTIYTASADEIFALKAIDGKITDTSGLNKLLAVNETYAEDEISAVGKEARRILVDTLRQGGSIEDAKDDIRKVFDDYDTDRLIRTELNRAGNAGTLDAYKVIPEYNIVRWMTSMDSLVDPVCMALEAQYAAGITIEEAEQSGIPPQHPHCRCRWVPKSEWNFTTGGT